MGESSKNPRSILEHSQFFPQHCPDQFRADLCIFSILISWNIVREVLFGNEVRSLWMKYLMGESTIRQRPLVIPRCDPISGNKRKDISSRSWKTFAIIFLYVFIFSFYCCRKWIKCFSVKASLKFAMLYYEFIFFKI